MTGVSDVDWLVISLKRTPERLEQFRATNGKLGLPVEVLEAVDGQQLDHDELVQAGFVRPDLAWRKGVVGSAMSHRLCWLRAVESGRPVVILEDDVYLRHDFADRAVDVFNALPPDWDTVHFGFNTDAVLDVECSPGCRALGHFSAFHPTPDDCERFVASRGAVAPVRLHHTFGVCSYAVSPKGAQRLLDDCFPLSEGLVYVPAFPAHVPISSHDVTMNGLYGRMSAHVCLPPIALVINVKAQSTIWTGAE